MAMDMTAKPERGLWLSRSRIAIKVGLKHLLAPVGAVIQPRKGIRILFYHRVNSHPFAELGLVSREITVPTDRFAWQMAYLAQHGYRTLRLDECRAMLNGSVPMDPKAVLLTFDDGYRDNLTDAAPILAKYGFSAVVYPVSAKLNGDNRDWPMGDPKGLGDFMSAEELRVWLSQGHEIGSHTVTHPVLTHQSDPELQHELAHSRATFEELFAHPCTSVVYPFGDADDRVSAAARVAGYALGMTTGSGTNLPGADMLALRRTEVSVSDTRLIFALKMRGYFDWLRVRDLKFYRGALRRLNSAAARLARAPERPLQ